MFAESKNIDDLEKFLYAVNEKTGFFASMIISDEGLIILSSNNKPNNDMDLESLAAMAAGLFSKDNINEYDLLKDIEVNYKEKKVFITKLDESLLNESKNIMFIIIIPPNIRYFKRKINKVKNKIKNFFIT